MKCEITDSRTNLTHTALQSEASPLRSDGGLVGPSPTGRVPISTEAAAENAASLPSLQENGPGMQDPPAGP